MGRVLGDLLGRKNGGFLMRNIGSNLVWKDFLRELRGREGPVPRRRVRYVRSGEWQGEWSVWAGGESGSSVEAAKQGTARPVAHKLPTPDSLLHSYWRRANNAARQYSWGTQARGRRRVGG